MRGKKYCGKDIDSTLESMRPLMDPGDETNDNVGGFRRSGQKKKKTPRKPIAPFRENF